MASIGVPAPRTRPRARATLAGLLAERDASLSVATGQLSRIAARAARSLGSARNTIVRGIASLVVFLAAFVSRHGLVLAGLAAFTIAAGQFSLVAALITGGAGAFFLELRRK
jgi:hypothetical protein